MELRLGQELSELHEDDGVLEFTPLHIQFKESVY